MLGLLGSALAGAGEAVQQNADNTLQAKREKALLALRDKYAAKDAKRRHEYNTQNTELTHELGMEELGQRHEYNTDNTRLSHDLSMEQERFRQGQQNYRTNLTASRRGSGGGLGGDLSDVQKRYLDRIEGQMEAIRESAVNDIGEPRPLTPEEKLQLGQLDQQWTQIATGGEGAGASRQPTPFEQLMQGDGGSDGGGGKVAPDGGGDAAPPPRPEAPQNFDDVAAPVREQRREQGLVRAAQEEADTIEQEINQIRGLAAQTSFGPRTTPQQREQLAAEVRERMDTLMQNYDLTEAQRGRLESAVSTILQRVGQ